MSLCSFCKKPRRLAAKGLCGTCYARYQRNGTAEYIRPNRSFGITECSFCNSNVGPFVKSLCSACYQQQYKTGSPERTHVRNLCERPGCGDEAKALGLCQRHYMRLRRHGTPDAGRPEGWGAGRKHPMYDRWRQMRRASRHRGGNDPRWDDFWAFLEDVGDSPSPRHRLYRKDEVKPYSKDNFEWLAPILDKAQLENKAEYQRVYRVKRPHIMRKNKTKALYGITDDWEERTLKTQNYVCAICGQPETQRNSKTGERNSLSIDHDGVTGALRGILCSAHNTGIGLFNHDIDLLQSAIDYLRSHQATGA